MVAWPDRGAGDLFGLLDSCFVYLHIHFKLGNTPFTLVLGEHCHNMLD